MSNCSNCKLTLKGVILRWFIERFLSVRNDEHNHDHNDDQPNGPCEYRQVHYPFPTNGTILTLVFHCEDGLIGYTEGGTEEESRKNGEDIMALYDIERVVS